MTDPTTGSPKNPARAWAVGCGLLVALAILATIALVSVTAWWLYRDDTPRPEPVLATGEERLWVEARFDPREAWVGEFAGRIVTGIGAIAPPEVPLSVALERADLLAMMPLTARGAVYKGGGDAPGTSVLDLHFAGDVRTARAAFRVVASAARPDGPIARDDAAGARVIVVRGERKREVAAAFIGSRLLVSNGAERLKDVLSNAGRPARPAIPESEIAALRSLVRHEGEDGWGYAAGSDPIAATVVSFDLAETDVIAWRAAVRLTSAIAEGAEAPAVIESLLGRLPEPLVATVTVPPSRSDARTIVAEGRVSGFGALADRFLRTLPGRAGPASPTR